MEEGWGTFLAVGNRTDFPKQWKNSSKMILTSVFTKFIWDFFSSIKIPRAHPENFLIQYIRKLNF